MVALAVRLPGRLHSAKSSEYLTGDNRVPSPTIAARPPKTCHLNQAKLLIEASAQESYETASHLSRRSALGFTLASTASLLLPTDPSFAASSAPVAGRLPGLSDFGEDGLRTYKRPPGKSGGHGVGWSEFLPYSFRVSEGWEEVPVSIADLGGTEIDLRFASSKEGKLSVVVAPLLRFSDGLGNNARIEDIGPPDRVIYAFGPELTGGTVEGKLTSMEVHSYEGRTYYQYEVEPHILVSATAAGNRLYILTVSASGRQWKKYAEELKGIASSFRVG